MNSILSKRGKIIAAFIVLYLAVFILSFSIGRFPVGPAELIRILLSRILPIEKTWTDQAESVVFIIRLPRILVASLVGMALAVSGHIFQRIFRNPMVSPDVLGCSAGAGFGASLALLYGLSGMGVSLSAFAMGLLAVLLVWKIGSAMRGNHILGLILSGIMISSIFQSGTSFVKLVADPDNELPAITYFLMGSLAGTGRAELRLIIVPMMAAVIPVLLLSWRLNILSLPEEEALSLGIPVRMIRAIAIASASLMTALTVAVAGMIGWVGLVIPHITRMTTGTDSRTSVPASMLLGAAFLTAVDTASRSITTSEIPIGILTSFIGAPFFLYLILKEGRQ